MLENKAQNSSGKQALRSTKFHALSRVTNEGYGNRQIDSDSTAIEIAAHVAKSAYAD